MRVDNANFTRKNNAATKEPRYSIELSFDRANTDRHYFTSHFDAQIPIGAIATPGVIHKNGISSTSQHINPDQGLATIGNITIKLVDDGEQISTLLNTKLDIGSGLRRKRIRIYTAFKDDSWSDYVLIQTQIIDSVSYQDGFYTIKCADIQRSERKVVFDLNKTNLSASITATDLKIPVYDNSLFTAFTHGSSFSDGANSSVFYVQIQDEIIRCSGISVDTTLGLVLDVDTLSGRGVIDTVAIAHVVDLTITDNERKTEVEEYCYLELPVPKLAYALLTGIVLDLATTLPDGWHLNIDPGYVRLSDFQNIGSDLYDVTDDTNGVIAVFKGLKKTDGKAFIEKELNLLIGCFNPIYSTGEIGLQRMSSVLAGASYVVELNESNVISFGAVEHSLREVRNSYAIDWSYDDLYNEYRRKSLIIDPRSISVHGASTLKQMKFKGLDGRRHTSATLNSIFNFLRDRFTSPPIKLNVKCLPSLNGLEVGDIVKVNLNNARDFNGSLAPLDRSFEIQNININWLTGNVDLKLFGSSSAAGELALGSDSQVLNDSFYVNTGTNLKTYLDTNYVGSYSEANGIMTINTNVTLLGQVPAIPYFYDGGLTIANGVIVTITKTVDLRCKGHLQIDGKIDGKGQGHPAVAGITTYFLGEQPSGTVGVMGNTWAWGGQHIHDHRWISGGFNISDPYMHQFGRVQVLGKYKTLPFFNLINDTASDLLLNIPSDLGGSSGGAGGNLTYHRQDTGSIGVAAVGGAGGAGGAGFITISRGVSFGASGSVDLSGLNGAVGVVGSYFNGVGSIYQYSGSGAGGAGGGWLTLIDGSGNNRPDVSKVKTIHGSSLPPNDKIWPVASESHLVDVASDYNYYAPYHTGYKGYPDKSAYHRIQYVTPDIIAVADVSKTLVIPPTNLSVVSGDTELLLSTDGTVISRIKASWTASIDQNIGGYEVEYKLSSELNFIPASNTLNLEINYVYIAPVKDGVNYDIRVRAINNIGIRSKWLTVVNYTVIKKQAPPPDCDTFLVQRLADGTRVFDGGLFAINRPVDFSGYEIRAALGTGLTWDQLSPLHSGVITQLPWETNQLSAGHYVAAIRAVDTSGNVSVNPKYIESDLGDPRISNAITTVDFLATGFSGIKTNCWVDPHSGELIALGTTPWSALTTWSAWTQWAMTWNASFSYEHTVIDIGIVTTFTPRVTVTSNGTAIVIEESHSDDNITFTAFAVVGSQVKARYIKIRITVTNTIELPKITQALVIIDADIIEEYIEDQDISLLTGVHRIGVGDIRLPMIKTYSRIKNVQIVLQNVSAGWSWVLIDKDSTIAPRIKIYNASQILADATIDAFISGA